MQHGPAWHRHAGTGTLAQAQAHSRSWLGAVGQRRRRSRKRDPGKSRHILRCRSLFRQHCGPDAKAPGLSS